MYLRINAFALSGRTNDNTIIPRVSLRLPWAMRSLGFQPAPAKSGRSNDNTIIPRVSLRLPWAKEVIGLSARLVCFCYILITGPANDYFTQSRATPSEAKLTIRCESRLRPELLDVMRSSNHSKCRMSLFLSCSCPLFLSVPFLGEGGEALRLSDF